MFLDADLDTARVRMAYNVGERLACDLVTELLNRPRQRAHPIGAEESGLDSGVGEAPQFVTQALGKRRSPKRRGCELTHAQPQRILQLLENAARFVRAGLDPDARGGEQLRLMIV